MTRSAESAPLTVVPVGFAHFKRFLVALHVLVVFIGYLSVDDALALALWWSFVLAHLGWAWGMHIARWFPWSIREARWGAQGWMLTLTSGRTISVELTSQSFVSLGLIVLLFSDGRFSRALVLFPDSLDAQQLRRLRVRLCETAQAQQRRRGGFG